MASLLAGGRVSGVVLLSTCNRVELYGATDGDPGEVLELLRRFLVEDRGFVGEIGQVTYALAGEACLEHLCRVAGGLDSMVLGETEILGQLKQAYAFSLERGYCGKELNRAFQSAFGVAKRIRSETRIQRGNTSIASVAVELAENLFGDLREREVIVLGAGEMGEKTARALMSRGAKSVLVSSRSHERAMRLAGELGGRAVRFEEWEAEFARVDILISGTRAPHLIVDRPRLQRLLGQREPRPLLLIDLAVPRDIAPDAGLEPGVALYNVDQLQTVADEHARLRMREVALCEELIRECLARREGRGPGGVLSPLAGRSATGRVEAPGVRVPGGQLGYQS